MGEPLDTIVAWVALAVASGAVALVMRHRARGQGLSVRDDGPIFLALVGLVVAVWGYYAGPFWTLALMPVFGLAGLAGLIWWSGRRVLGRR